MAPVAVVSHASCVLNFPCRAARHRQRRRLLLRYRPSMASCGASANNRLRPITRTGCAQTGPLEHGERPTDQSEGWRTGCAPVRRRHMDVPSANPGGRERIRSTGMCGGRVRGVAFSLVTFSWPSKRKSPAPPGGARKTDRDVVQRTCEERTLTHPSAKTGPALYAALPEGERNARASANQTECPVFINHATTTVWINRITSIASTGDKSKPPISGNTL